MSEVWDAHFKRIQDLIAANPVPRYSKPAPPAPTPTPNWQDLLQQSGISPEGWYGGADGGMNSDTAAGNLGDLVGSLGLNGQSVGGLLGALGGGLIGGPFGGLLGGLAGRGIGGMVGGADSGGGFGGGDPANAQSGASQNSAANSGVGQGGNMMGDGTFQKGGYTGAGKDGVVQPHRKAGTVHEGELVIPHHMVKRMGLLAR